MTQTKARKDININDTWAINEMFENDQALNIAFETVEKQTDSLGSYKGEVLKDAETLLKVLNLRDKVWKGATNLYTFTRMSKDIDNRDAKWQGLFSKAVSLDVKADGAMSYIVPELLKADFNQIDTFIKEMPELEIYRFHLSEVYRQKAHVLSEKEERILALAREMAGAPENIYGMLNNADIKFDKVTNEKGESIELTKGNFIKFMESPDQSVRRQAFLAFYKSYAYMKNTIGAAFIASYKADTFYAKTKKYESTIESALDDDFVPITVYDNLIGTIHNRMDLMHRYVVLRKKMLKLDELHIYDVYAPLVANVDKMIQFDDAKAVVKKGLQPLGQAYLEVLDKGYAERWIDVFETEGKTSGAYSWGTYESKPFVLLNYQGNLDHVFTLAHEMGHSIHSYYSNEAQEYINSNYKIFVAEVASTVNETLLIKDMLNQDIDVKERMYLLNHFMDQFKGTVYRQTMFAEFEKLIHGMVDRDEEVTMERLCDEYYKLNRLYFGDDIILDDEIKYEWMRIPHFYSSFYVYKYATGFSAAVAIADKIEQEGQPAVDAYTQFLKSGGSDHPIDLLKIAGVDMTTAAPIESALDLFEKVLDEMESLVEQL